MAEGKRIKKIHARFTEDEFVQIEKLEQTLGINKTDLVRLRLLKDAPAIIINAKELISAVDAIGAELGRCGNNINQLARHANILSKQGKIDPIIIERFNFLFKEFIQKQELLENTFRKIIRVTGR